MSDESLTEHARRNRAAWDALAADYVASGERKWASDEPCWGVWRLPEQELRVLPDVAGLDAIELGCGTAYWSAWLARRGARPVGVDNSERQLETARRLQGEHGLEFPLIHASAEAVPLDDAGFDLAFSEYGTRRTRRLLRAPGDAQKAPGRGLLHTAAPPSAGLAAERASVGADRAHRVAVPGGRPRRSRCRRSAEGPGQGPGGASRRARKRPGVRFEHTRRG